MFEKDPAKAMDRIEALIYEIKCNYPYNIYFEVDSDHTPVAAEMEFALAGFDPADISIKVIGDELRISTARKGDRPEEAVAEPEASGRMCVRQGIARRSLDTGIKLSSLIDKGAITSTFVNGLLSIRLPVAKTEVVEVRIGDNKKSRK